MKKFLIISALTLPMGIFAQGNFQINPPPQQAQTINYYNQIDDNNNSLENTSSINDDENPIQTNIAIQQKANPHAEQQGVSLGNFFSSSGNDGAQQNKPCTDCDEVKQAIKASHAAAASSGNSHHRKSLGMKKWGKKFSYNTNLKIKKMFAKKYKAKTTFASCFSWG